MRYSNVNTNIEIGSTLPTMPNEFRDWIREFRRVKGITQADLADRLKVSQTTVSQWEAGRNRPTIGNLQALAQLSERPLSEFLPFLGDEQAGLARADLDPLALEILQMVANRPDSEQAAILATVKALVENFDRGKREPTSGAGGTATRTN